MTREEREKAITYFEQCNSNIISVCKDENNYDYEKQDIISYSARKTYEANKLAIEALEFVTSYEGTINKLTEALNQQKEGHWIEFAKWVASEIFDELWEYNKESFDELACRKLAKLGIVRAKGDEWELVESQESER